MCDSLLLISSCKNGKLRMESSEKNIMYNTKSLYDKYTFNCRFLWKH